VIGADCRASCAKLIAALSRQATVVDAAAAHAARLIAKSAPEGAAEHRGFWEADGACDLADLSDRARWMGEESEGTFQPLFLDEAAKALPGLGEQHVDIAVADAMAAADRLGREPCAREIGEHVGADRREPCGANAAGACGLHGVGVAPIVACDLADRSDRARRMGEQRKGSLQALLLDEAAKALSGLGEQQMDIAVADAVAAADRLRRQPGVGGVGQRIVANRGEPRRADAAPFAAVTIASGVTPSADTSRS
jgi:hypothetical protein